MSVLKVKTGRIGKFFGKSCQVGENVTDMFDPLNVTHVNMLNSGALKLVKIEDEPAKIVIKTETKRGAK